MATVTVRDIDEETKRRLRQKAATRGVSMEEEARAALRAWTGSSAPGEGLGTFLHKRFLALGGAELDPPPRGATRPLPGTFDE